MTVGVYQKDTTSAAQLLGPLHIQLTLEGVGRRLQAEGILQLRTLNLSDLFSVVTIFTDIPQHATFAGVKRVLARHINAWILMAQYVAEDFAGKNISLEQVITDRIRIVIAQSVRT